MSRVSHYVAVSSLPVSVKTAFAYHERPGALRRLTPPWESVVIEHTDHSITVGSRVVMKVRIGGLPLRWVAEHTQYDPPNRFADRQISGPFASWNHQHRFESVGDKTRLIDDVEYRLPLGTLGRLFGSGKARATLESMFAYRHRVTRDDLVLQADHPVSAMTVAISGSNGLVGSHLQSLLTLLGHRVISLVRRSSDDPNCIAPWQGTDEAMRLSGVDAVVHLAGQPIADKRWTEQVKSQIRDSRIGPTGLLCESLARLPQPPKVLICASATGIYGNRDDEFLDEQSRWGDDFLSDVAGQWEAACRPAADAGIRVVNTRFGIILSPGGGALKQMLLPAKALGGSLGRGDQWWSWIALDDAFGAIYHSITDDTVSGPVNVVAPEPIRNADFAKTLGQVLGRPAIFPAPAMVLRIALGEMADALLLASTRVRPAKLIDAGYRYRFTDLEAYLKYALGKNRLPSQ